MIERRGYFATIHACVIRVAMAGGEPRAIFLATVLFMTITALVALLEERAGAKR